MHTFSAILQIGETYTIKTAKNTDLFLFFLDNLICIKAFCGKEETVTIPSHGKQQGNDLTHVCDSKKDTLKQ